MPAMREVSVIWNFNGEIVGGKLSVRADFFKTPHDVTQLKNLLECNGRVLMIEDIFA